jgi:hypothetical protein
MSGASRQVALPEALCVAVEKRFGNLESFLVFVMGEMLRDEAAVLDEKEQRLVEERLRELGYL